MDFLDFEPVEIHPVDYETAMEFLELEPARAAAVERREFFRCLELDPARRLPSPDYQVQICKNCGYPNPLGIDFCRMCQMELTDFRNLELDVKTVKVLVKFPRQKNLKMCDVCGTFNEIGQPFCSGCMAAL